MPLQTQIIRNGEPLALRWGGWHLSVMQDAAVQDSHVEWAETPLHETGRQVLTHDYSYIDHTDGEVLDLLAGDELVMWR